MLSQRRQLGRPHLDPLHPIELPVQHVAVLRILVPNFTGNSVSLWKAADFTALGTFSIGSGSP